MSNRASLNHVYRTVWNSALGAMVAVAEIASSGGRAAVGVRGGRSVVRAASPPLRLGALSLAIALGWATAPPAAFANPEGGVAIVGTATMATTGNRLVVTTQNGAGTNYSAINWQSFSIPAGSTTHFQQPNAASTSINRVVTNTPSVLFGTLSSNGSLVLVNQAGIAVGSGAVVDTAGFTASSLRMSDADALAGRLRFGDDSTSTSGVSVQGRILARSGDVVLIGSSVSTGSDALIEAPNGSTILAAGQKVEITGRGLEGIVLQVQAPTDSAVNLGTLKAGAVGVFAGTLRHSGAIQATTATLEGGKVVLKASGDAYVSDDARIDASSAAGKGGSVAILGNRVAVTDRAVVDASGATGGGEILVGGDYQGKNALVQNAKVTYVGANTQLLANARTNGNGGKVIVWADDATRYFGTISANGGSQSGNGGTVEVSGKKFLSYNGTVTTSAANGKKGTLLLDPTNIYIAVDQATATALGMVGTDNSVDLAGPTLFSTSGTPADSLLTTATLDAALVSNNVTVSTSSSGGGAGNIVVGSNVTKSAGAGTSLTLQADNDIVVNGGISISSTSTAHPLDVVLTASGAIVMNTGSAITSKGGNITLSGVGNATNTTGVKLTGATLSAETGNISITGAGVAGIPSINSGIEVGTGSSLITTSGNITLNGTGGASGGVYNNKYGILLQGGTIQTASGAIALTGTGGSNGTGSNMGVYLNGGAVSATTSGTVSITGNGGAGSTGGLNYGVLLAGGTSGLSVSSANGSVTIDGTATGNSEGVRAYGFGQAVSVTSSGSASISFTGAGSGVASQNSFQLDGSSGAVTIGGSSASGAISFVAGGVLEDIAIGTGVSIKSTGTLSLKPFTGSTSIGVGNGTGAFTLDATELGALTNGFSSITIGSATHTGLISAGTAAFNDNLTLESGGGVSITGALASAGNTITLKFGTGGVSTIGAGAGITASTLNLLGDSYATLDGSNTVSTFSAVKTGGNTNQFLYWNTGALSLGAITTTGDLEIRTAGGALTQSTALSVSGLTTLNTGSGSVTLTNSSNNFGSVAISGAGAVSLQDANALSLTNLSVGSLNAYAVGNLTLAGSINASAAGDAVVLRTDGNLGNSTASITTPNGRWLAYVKSVGGHSFVSTPAFKQFNSAYGATVLGTGNGVLYDPAVVAVLTGTLGGSITKSYDGTTSISLTGATLTAPTGFAEAFTPVGTVTLSGTGTLASPDIGTGISTTVSNAAVDPMVDAGGLKVYGYKANTSGAIASVTKAVNTLQPFAGTTLADFADKFETLLIRQDTRDDKAKGTDGLVVEGEICRI
jgi:filamentous hemagglutinin family protein